MIIRRLKEHFYFYKKKNNIKIRALNLMVKGIRDHQGIQEWREMRLFCCVMGGVFFLAFVGFEF